MRLALGFAVLTLAAASPPSVVSVSPSTTPGTRVALTVEGAGLDAPASVPEVYGPDGALVASGSVTRRAAGRLEATFGLAGVSPGAYTVKVAGPDGTRSNALALTLVPEVNVAPRSGHPGQPFTYTGRGFTGRSGATTHLQGTDGLEWQAKRISLSPEGTFEQVIVSGEFVPGTYAVWAMDDRTRITAPKFTFEVLRPAAPR